MLNVLRKEAMKNLLKKGEVTFNKDLETTFKNTKYKNLLINLDISEFDVYEYQEARFYLLSLIKTSLKVFFEFEVEFKLKFFEYPKELEFVMKRLYDVSENTFLVGGAIRDIINKRTPKDFDIVTEIPFEILKEIFKDYKQKEVGKHFKVLMVKIGQMEFEIANFRKDIYEYANGRGADRVNIGTLEDDIQRRDFDVNCLYYKPFTKIPILIDGNQTGLLSLYKKEFRFVGSPADRIKEDVLRLLRIGKLKKKGLTPTKETMKAFRNYFNVLCEFGNKERIREHIEELCF